MTECRGPSERRRGPRREQRGPLERCLDPTTEHNGPLEALRTHVVAAQRTLLRKVYRTFWRKGIENPLEQRHRKTSGEKA